MKHKSNIDMVVYLMQFSRYGALGQIFIIEAMRQYAERVLEAERPENDGGIVSWPAWRGVAREIKQAIDDQYGTEEEVQ